MPTALANPIFFDGGDGVRRRTCRPAPAGALCPTPAAAYLRCSRDQQNIVLCAGNEPGLRRVAFELESRADLGAAMAHFTSAGDAPRSLSADERGVLKQGDRFRVRERHSGLELEFFAATTLLAKACVPTVAKIVRLGHGVIGSADFARRRMASSPPSASAAIRPRAACSITFSIPTASR